jgi:hypothetical protein
MMNAVSGFSSWPGEETQARHAGHPASLMTRESSDLSFAQSVRALANDALNLLLEVPEQMERTCSCRRPQGSFVKIPRITRSPEVNET